jgi:hypothetical protein
MRKAIAQVNKLRGKSVRELSVRGRQELAKLGERLPKRGPAEMSDTRFNREIETGLRAISPEGAAISICDRMRPRAGASGYQFFPSLKDRETIIAVMERRFPAQRRLTIERADRAIEGTFDLLGLSDLSFGSPIDWHLEPVSGKRTGLGHWNKIDYLNPEVAGDKKITWELSRHAHFVAFGQAYWLTGDEKYASAFVSQATSWMDANPPGRGINWASSLEAAFRAIAWLWALHLFAGSPELTPRFALRILKCLIAHGRHIETYLSYYFSPNTHLTGEALALFYLGTALHEFRRASTWRGTGLRVLLEQLPVQVQSDGVYFEQATYYHRYTVDFYLHLLILARAGKVGLPGLVEEKLALMLDHLMWITRPDGASPLIGDDDGGRLIKLGERRLNDFRDTLATGAALFGRGDWKRMAGDAMAEMLWLLGPDGVARYDEIKSVRTGELSRAFAASGYYVLRDGWSRDSSYAVIDCGPHGALACGHAHSDALAFEYGAMGKAWLVDPGTYTYTGDAQARNEFRLTGAHNTVVVDDSPQSVPGGSFSWNQVARASAFDYFDGTHYGYERLDDPVKHRRAIFFVRSEQLLSSPADFPSYLTVRDNFTAGAGHRYAIRYHVSPGCSVVADGNQVIVSEPGGGRLRIAVFGDAQPRARIEHGWVSSAYGQRDRALVAAFEAEGEGPQQFTTFIIPSASGQPLHVEQQQVDATQARGFRVPSEKSFDVILLGDGSTPARCGPLAASGLIAWGRFVNNELKRACLAHGQSLETGDGIRFASSGLTRQCSIRQSNNGIEISARDMSRFGNEAHEPAARLSINGTAFSLERGWQTARLANDGSGWKMSNAS